MIKNFKNIDSIFKSSYESFEEEPSEHLWTKINAGLDKQDMARYKKGIIAWKRVTLFLIFVMTIYVLYDSLLRNPDSGRTVSGKQQSPNGPANPMNAMPMGFVGLPSNGSPNYFNSTKKGKLIAAVLYIPAESVQIGAIDSMPIRMPDFLGLVLYPKALATDKGLLENGPAGKDNLIKPNLFNPYWSVSALASYDHVMYRLDDDLPGDSKENIENRENHKASFSFGISADWYFKKSWALQTGLVYSHVLVGIGPQKIYASAESSGDVSYKYITSSGYAFIKPGLVNSSVGDSLSTATANHHLVFISLPLKIKHQFGIRRFSLLPSAGFAANFLAKATISTVVTEQSRVESVTITKLNGTRQAYLSLDASLGLQYRLTRRTTLSMEPSFKYAITSMTHNNVVNNYPYSIGIGIGAQMSF